MKNKSLLWIIIIVIVIVVILMVISASRTQAPSNGYEDQAIKQEGTEEQTTGASEDTETSVKEFSMESFVEFVDNQFKPQFSVKEIVAQKGDTVRIKVTNTKGTHDFKLDEFNIYEDTPLNQEVVIEFIADKTGEFIYYCNQPGHRAAGQWGTLKVID